MSKHVRSVLILAVVACVTGASSLSGGKRDIAIVCPRNATYQENLAAKEIRRYVYLRTGALLRIENADAIPAGVKSAIVVGTAHHPLVQRVSGGIVAKLAGLKPEEFLLRTVTAAGRTIVVVSGGDDTGTLYAAYRFAERMGMQFGLDGDVVPDGQMPLVLPALDEVASPLFKLRGIQPFHDFPEGPDWWNTDDYKAILGQLPKMGMNFFGLHTYPERAPNAEPTVWIGREGEWNSDGTVKKAYPASYQNTVRGNWGYAPTKTGEYHCGAAMLFDRDDYSSDVMRGLTPEPSMDVLNAEVFNRTGAMLRQAFTSARRLGVKTCVGTETFLTIPDNVKDRITAAGKNPGDDATIKDLYKGIFGRIADTYPIDYYWLWTPEGWTWEDAAAGQISKTVNDLSLAIEAAKECKAPFQLATCGWVLGPPSDRGLFDRVLPKDVSVSCINREVGKAPVDPAFARIQGRSRWAIPWMEDDPSLLAPELWAGRTRKDAADALAYGCDGLLGIHWRTRILSPNIMALAQSAWDQKSWLGSQPTGAERRGPINGVFVQAPDTERIANTHDAQVYRTVRDRVFGYHLSVPNGTYKVTLQFCEPLRVDKRVFDVLIQGAKVVDGLDIAARVGYAAALDCVFENIGVADSVLAIDFADRIGFPSVAGIVVEGNGFVRKINCGGPACGDYEADQPPTPRWLSTADLYREWALHQFGPDAAKAAGAIFASIDSRLPEPATWLGGPGGVKPNDRPWQDVEKQYAFVDSLLHVRDLVHGKANTERFNFWANTFLHMREMAKLGCLWGEYSRVSSEAMKVRHIPSAMLIPAAGTGHGLSAEYYNNPALTGTPAITRVDSAIAFAWSDGAPCAGVHADSFSVRWTGALLADASGRGKLGVTSDDGVRLWVDGKMLIDDWTSHSLKTQLVDFEFEAGRKYDVKLEYFEDVSGAEVHLLGGVVSPDSLKREVELKLVPLRREMIESIKRLYGYLLATVTNSSELGTIANWEQHNFPVILDEPGAELSKLLGKPLPVDLQLPRAYDGQPGVIVPTVRTCVEPGEKLKVRALVLSAAPVEEASLKWRKMGMGPFDSVELKHLSRGVYEATLPAGHDDIEYYVVVKTGGQELFFPASAPEVGQTVVVASTKE